MAKKKAGTVIGLNFDHGRLSMTLVRDGRPSRAVYRDIPDEIAKDGDFQSKNLYAEFLKDTIKENQLSCKNIAYVIPGGRVFTRNVTLPRMTADQLRVNLPFEFRDYIRGELGDYIFDYAYRPPLQAPAAPQGQGADKGAEEQATERETIDLLAVAVPEQLIIDVREVMHLAGLHLVKAAPDICVYESLLGKLDDPEEQDKERCFLDLGLNSSRMLIYKNRRYKLAHMVDIGTRHIVQAVADEKNVDMHIAKTYLESDYEECLSLPAVTNAYKDISLEVLKGINFYEMADMSARLKDVVLTGVGAQIAPLVEILKERITMNVLTMSELYPQYNADGAFNITAMSYGIALE